VGEGALELGAFLIEDTIAGSGYTLFAGTSTALVGGLSTAVGSFVVGSSSDALVDFVAQTFEAVTADPGDFSSSTVGTTSGPISLSDQNSVAFGNNATFSLTNNVTASVFGSSDALSTGTNNSANFFGTSNNLTIGAGSVGGLGGSGNTTNVSGTGASVLDTGTADTVNISATDAAAALTGSGSSVTTSAGSSSTITLAGADESATDGSTGDTITDAGTDDTIAANSDTVDFSADASGTVAGGDNTLQANAGDDLSLSGGGNTVTLTGADTAVTLNGTEDSFDAVYATGDALGGAAADGQASGIVLGADAQANITGSYDGVSLATGATLGLYGGGNTIDAGADDAVVLASTDDVFDLVNVTGDQLGGATANGQGTGIYLGDDTQANVIGGNDGVTLDGGATLGLYGGGNTVDAGADDAVVLGSTDDDFDTVDVNGDQLGGAAANGQGTGIYLDNNTQANVSGGNDGVSLAGGATLGMYGGGNTIDAGADDSVVLASTDDDFDTVDVNGDQLGGAAANGQGTGIYLGDDTQASLTGSNDGVILATGDTVYLTGGGETIDGGADESISILDTDNDFDTVDASDDTQAGNAANGAGTGIYLGSDVQASVSGNGDGVILSTGDTADISGGGDTIGGGAGESISLFSTGNDYDTVYASDDTQASDASNGADSGIYLGADVQASVSGNGDGVILSNGDTADISGGGNSIGGGADESISLFSTGNDSDTVNASDDALGGAASNGVETGIFLAGDVEANVSGNDDGTQLSTGDALHVYGGGDSVNASADDSVSLFNTSSDFDTVNATGDQFGGAASDGEDSGIFVGDDAQANISGSDNGINFAAGAAAGVYGGDNTISAGADELVVLGDTGGSFDTVDASYDEAGAATADGQGSGIVLNPDTEATINGSNDGISVYNGSVANIYGGGNTINAEAGDALYLSSTGGIADVVEATDDSSRSDTALGETAGITVAEDSEIDLDGDDDSLTLTSNDNAILSGGNDVADSIGSGNTAMIVGTGTANGLEFEDTITFSNATVDVGTGADVDVIGQHDLILGSGGNTITVDGGDDIVSDDDSTIDIEGGYRDDYIDGSDDGGYGWTYGDGYGYGYDLAASSKKSASASINQVALYDATAPAGVSISAAAQEARTVAFDSAAASEAGTTAPSAIFENAVWTSDVITWSFAAGGSSSGFSSSMTAQEEAVVEQAVQAWAAASGLIFEEVPDSPSADIRIGLGDFNSSNSGVLGYTSYLSDAGQLEPGAVVRLEDPNETPLTADTAGDLTYSGTDATFYQVALHEIGHALGLADNADPNSVMYYQASTSNQQLDATDVAEITALYGSLTGVGASPNSAGSDTDLATLSSGTAMAATTSVAASGAASVTTAAAATPTSLADTASSGSVSQTIQDNFSPAIAQLINAMAVFGASTELATAASIPANTNLNTENALAASA
jgi:hypothetical protein